MNLFDRISNVGVSDSMGLETQKRIQALNIVTALVLFMALIMTMAQFAIGLPTSAITITVFSVLTMMIPAMVNLSGRHVLARVLFVLAAYLVMLMLSIVYGGESHFQYILIAAIGMPLILFQDEIGHWKWFLASLAIPIFCFLTWHSSQYAPLIIFDHSMLKSLSVVSDLTVFLTILGVMAIFTRQHQQQMGENALQKEEAEFNSETLKLALNSSKMGMWEWDLNKNELVWDDQMFILYGVERENFSGAYEAWSDGLHPEDSEPSQLELQEALDGTKDFNTQFRVVHPDKTVHHLRAAGTVQRFDDGSPKRMIGLNWDITDEKNIESELTAYSEKLQAKNKELNEFSYIASHDLQEPINTITAFGDLLLKQYGSRLDDTGKEYLGYMKGSGVRAKELITDLLDYNRLGADRVLKTVNLNELVNDVRLDLSDSITKSNARVQIGGLPTVKAYEVELRQVFQNLIGNALKFTSPESDPWVKVTAKNLKNEIEISIEDNGIGIEEKHFDRIFAVFRRLHSKSEYAGTGIGLAHCKKIVEMHKGNIRVESTPDQGSTFYFTISKKL